MFPELFNSHFGFAAELIKMLIEHGGNNFLTIVMIKASPIWRPIEALSLASLECQSKEDDAKQMDNLHFFQSPVMMRAFVRE